MFDQFLRSTLHCPNTVTRPVHRNHKAAITAIHHSAKTVHTSDAHKNFYENFNFNRSKSDNESKRYKPSEEEKLLGA
jgi:hypothetical protein